MVESIIWILLEIYFSFQQWKNCENPLRIDKVIAMSMVYYFLGHSIIICKLMVKATQCWYKKCAVIYKWKVILT